MILIRTKDCMFKGYKLIKKACKHLLFYLGLVYIQKACKPTAYTSKLTKNHKLVNSNLSAFKHFYFDHNFYNLILNIFSNSLNIFPKTKLLIFSPSIFVCPPLIYKDTFKFIKKNCVAMKIVSCRNVG